MVKTSAQHEKSTDKQPKKARFCLDKNENDLESFLFADITTTTILSNDVASKAHEETPLKDVAEIDDSLLFFVDKQQQHSGEAEDIVVPVSSKSDEQQVPGALWHDEDDDLINIVDESRLRKFRREESEETVAGRIYEDRLRQEFERLYPKPKWATEQADDGEQEPDGFTTVGKLFAKKSRVLLPDSLQVTRVRDANVKEYSEAVVRSVNWHPNGKVLLTAGLDKTLRLFHIDGRENEKLQSVHFQDLPITKAQFMPNGQEIILTGGKKFFYSYNVETGKTAKTPYIRGCDERVLTKFATSPCGKVLAFLGSFGNVIMVSAVDKQHVGTIHMNGVVNSVAFSNDGKYLLTAGLDGDVYQWDVASRRCVHRFAEEGGVGTTQIAVSPADNQYFASGGKSGIVNLYRSTNPNGGIFASNFPATPMRSLMNLTTEIDQISFNHDSQLMGICSRVKKDHFKLVHLPSGRVFANWPTAITPLGYTSCFDFSPNSGYLSIGNDKGKVLLYRLDYFPSS